jgi:P pilus assembly chaperone PapD
MKMKRSIFSMLLLFAVLPLLHAQRGTSVSPSRLYFKVAPGGYKSQTIHVTNSGKTTESFTVTFANFSSPGNRGKTKIDTSMDAEHGLARWLSASPSFFEVGPGETKDVEILLQLPNTPEANTVRWGIIIVKSAIERKAPKGGDSKTVGMQIVQSFQFGIHVFQTPPAVVFKEVTVRKFYRDSTVADSLIHLRVEVENTGDAIADCAPYLDITNLKTGENMRVKGKGFTILPDGFREILFTLPKDFPAGEYSILGVVDYGSTTDFAASELKLKIP